MADMMEVPAPDEVISNSAEMKEWLFKVIDRAFEEGLISHVANAPIKSVGQFGLVDLVDIDEDAQVFAVAFGDDEFESGELVITVGPIVYDEDMYE